MSIQQKGFSFIELMLSTALLGVLLMLAAPSYASIKSRSASTSVHNLLMSSFATARQHAVNTKTNTKICPGNSATGCRKDGVWNNGWIVFVDNNDNGIMDIGDRLVRNETDVPVSVAVYSGSSRPYAVFNADGMAGGNNMTLRICSAGEPKAALILGNTGRIRAANDEELRSISNCQ